MDEQKIQTLTEDVGKLGLSIQAKFKEVSEGTMSKDAFAIYEKKTNEIIDGLKDEIAALKVPPMGSSEEKSKNVEMARKEFLTWQTSMHTAEFPKETGLHTGAWVSESGTKSETTGMTWGKDTLTPHECYALIDVSNQNLEDSVFNLEAEISEAFSKKFGVLEGTAFVSGNGVGQPEGITLNTTVVASYKTTSGSSAVIVATDLMTAFYALKGDYAKNANWLMNRAMVGYIRKFTDGTTGQFLWQPGMVAGTPDTLLGVPIVEATDMASAVGSSVVVAVLGDFKRGYKIVDRIGMTVQRDPYTQATSGNVRFIARKRVDGKVVLPEAFRLLACGA